jgi:hypothetical protein
MMAVGVDCTAKTENGVAGDRDVGAFEDFEIESEDVGDVCDLGVEVAEGDAAASLHADDVARAEVEAHGIVHDVDGAAVCFAVWKEFSGRNFV